MKLLPIFALSASVMFTVSAPIAPASAHGGGLNAEGCHNNRKTGDYHCHRGSSAAPARTLRAVSSSSERAFANCSEARAAGAAPVRVGGPWVRDALGQGSGWRRVRVIRAIIPLFLVTAATAACSEQGNESSTRPIVLVPAPAAAPTPVAPSPNYDEREGESYLYVAAVSEEERKSGKVAGEVVTFRYLGVRNGVHRIETLTDAGSPIDVAECTSPCKVIKVIRADGTTDRIGFTSSSIIGSAFEDAFMGRLVVAKGAPKSERAQAGDKSAVPIIPAAFRGEWNANVEHCGTGLSDSRLRVEPGRLRFYESDAQVSRVSVTNARAALVEASFSGEGQTWRDTVNMVLSRSGNDLTIDGLTRHRCPD
jgi:hypothetical protein